MSINIVNKTEKQLGYPEFVKIDPVTMDLAGDTDTQLKFYQSITTSVLATIFVFVQKKDNGEKLLEEKRSSNWLNYFFGNDYSLFLESLREYTGKEENAIQAEVDKICNAVKLILITEREKTDTPVKTVLNNERFHILTYLPGPLKMGHLLGDETLDDRSNKMRGPMSNFGHTMEELFT